MQQIQVGTGKLTSAVLYRTGAEITRTCSVQLLSGESLVSFTGLSGIDTARLSLSGRGDFTVVSFVPLPDGGSGESEQTRAAGKALAEAEAEVTRLHLECDFWKANMAVPQGTAANELDGTYRYFSERLAANCAALAAACRKRDDAAAALQRSKADDNRTGADLPKTRVDVLVRAEAPCEASLALTAFTAKAGWQPAYDLYADPESRQLRIDLRAEAWQATGEDLPAGCETVFSTGAPRGGMALPEFQPDYLGTAMPKMSHRALAARPMALMATVAETDAADTAADFVRQTEGGTDLQFTCALPLPLACGDRGRQITLSSAVLTANLSYRCIEPFDTSVYLVATVEAGTLPLAASARTYVAGVYGGNTQLLPESTEICLGRVDGVRVSRKQGKRYSADMLLGGKKTDCDFTLTVVNAKKQSVEVTVISRLPVSADKAVSVEPKELSGAVWEKETGKLTYTLTLRGGETKSLPVRYQIVSREK